MRGVKASVDAYQLTIQAEIGAATWRVYGVGLGRWLMGAEILLE